MDEYQLRTLVMSDNSFIRLMSYTLKLLLALDLIWNKGPITTHAVHGQGVIEGDLYLLQSV